MMLILTVCIIFLTSSQTKLRKGIGQLTWYIVQLAGAVEYTDCIVAKGKDLTNECPSYDTKQSDGEAPVMLEFWGMWMTPSLPLLLGPLWAGVVAPDRALSIGQIEV